jgi:hypothetical protein
MKATDARTRKELDDLAIKHNSSGFPLRLEMAYGEHVRATMWHDWHKIITVCHLKRVGICATAMRNELVKGNFCPTCGAVK